MRKILGSGLFLLISFGFSAFSSVVDAQTPPFTGIWQGVEAGETGIRIEFTPEGYYRLSVGDKKLTDHIECWGEVKFSWGKEQDRYLITIFGEREPDITTRLEAVFLENGLLQLELFSETGKSLSSILLKKV